jgi:hypothetical protein
MPILNGDTSMKFGILSVAASLALTVSATAAFAQQPGDPIPQPLPTVPPVVVAQPSVVVAQPTVIVPRPVVVVPAPVYPGVTIVRPGISVGIGGVYPAPLYYGRPYYGYGHGYYHHR